MFMKVRISGTHGILPDTEEFSLSEARRGCEGGRPRCPRRVSVSAFVSPSRPRPRLDLKHV
jgi:hypothetical protein